MYESKMIEQHCKQLASLLETIGGFFVEGAIPAEQAYACSVLAREYVNRLQELDHDSGMIEFYELNPEFRPIMFSSDMAIREQLDRLEDSRGMLLNSSPPRHELLMIPTSASAAPPVKPSTTGE